ncbi:Cullin-9 [Bagarius yarrelli]|uniref:Cullin-9 n=1 Tax=Bagarius yarrelli TaxID=175774 RepID=A0A556TR92_BAGYA|nr:Cullin-9 [Bagarius yarrelli]
MDKLNTSGSELSTERQEPEPSSSTASHQSDQSRLQRQFEFTMAMANLISELVRVMGWDRNRQPSDASPNTARRAEETVAEVNRHTLRSIFQPRFSASTVITATVTSAPAPPKKTTNGFRTRTDFSTRSAYVEYVQETLQSGMHVRMLEDYEDVSSGDEGEFRYSNDGSPPVQVYWNSISRTYWVHWHMIEIVGSGSSVQEEKKTHEKAFSLTETLKHNAVSQMFFLKPPGGLYSLPYLTDSLQDDAGTLTRAEWWEVLFFIKKLEPKQQQEINNILRQNNVKQASTMAELDESTLIQMSVSSEVACKILHYLKQTLQSSCLNDLLCSHAFVKHYLRRGAASLEDEEMFNECSLNDSGLGGQGSSSSLLATPKASTSSASFSINGCVSKKPKKEFPIDKGSCNSDTESELPAEDETKYPEDLEEKMKLFNNPKVQSKKTALEKIGEVVDIMKKSSSDSGQLLAGMKVICKILDEEGPQEHSTLRSDLAQSTRDKVLKLLVVMVGSQQKPNVIMALLLTRSLMLKYEWRVSFATEGGVKAILSCMQEYPTCTQVQQIALATLKVITGASKHDLRSVGSCLPLSESGTQMMLEIFASIGSATPEGSKGLLEAIPSAIDLMLNTAGGGLSMRNGLLVIIMLISNHKSLAEQLVACEVTTVLRKCLSGHTSESMLAIIALNHISNVHKLEKRESEEMLDFKDTELKMLVVGLKEMTTTKEVIQTLEQLLCDESSQLEDERNEVLHSRDTFQDLAVQQFIHFLYRLASQNKDCTVVMCRLGTKEALVKALDKHSTNLLLVTELRDLINDCEKYASLYKKMTTSSSVELKEDKCWEKVEVSSNHHRANKLTDKNPKTFWESNGCTGSHFINVYMHKGVVIRQLVLLVASDDSSYMPARIIVLGGDDPTSIKTELNTVNVAPSASRVILLENMTRFWPIIQIGIKRCQQGGIDTRVHGFEILGPKPTFWPVFKEQLCCRTYLFYTTKAHTWCQEILGDKKQLLQLFNKLNSALRHEQMFADRFLPDAEAAEALGRTCWEALITPIVQSITLSDGKEGKNKGASGVTSSSSTAKPKIKNSSSIAGVALCWQSVVQGQMKKFLDLTYNLPEFVECYKNMYLRLKNAMEELFGQQTAFVLALRQGFSAALLQLSILTSMHVSERFAQYIDHMIRQSGVDSGNVETLNKLQKFLEPMLFLSGLELANTFEHFYRYYLGDRLLSQGNLWLESAVIEQICTCFPERFPQQMLNNLSDSDELQQEFHLYRLQQLDKSLQDMNEEMADEQMLDPEDEGEVKELSLQALQQATGLSLPVLIQALTPLISEKGILSHEGLNQDLQKGLLRLNKMSLAQSSEKQRYCNLLPKQTYLNVDEDAALTLERKRNHLYCLIVQIMKNEKEMHIDNLVFKVMDTCQKQEAASNTGRFSCSTTDVLSCIMHVINKGYIRRNEDNPHIVEYIVEDPSTPQKRQAHFFSRVDLNKCKGSTKADTSLGGSILVPQQVEDGALETMLFSMGRTMTQEEVKRLMRCTIQQLADTLSLEEEPAEHLLMHCKWNIDMLIQRYTDDPETLMLAAGLKIRNPHSLASPMSLCPVCLVSWSGDSDSEPLMLSCRHYCCRYENALLRGYVECCSNLTWCTNPQGCDQILCKENIGSMGTCSKCCWSSCFSCNFPEAHYPASCSHMSQWMDDGGYYEGMSMEAQSKHLAKLISKRCPSCQAQIEKNEGCLHMTCAKCNHGFCWRCLKPWKPTHKDYYNCSAMEFAINLENKVSSINEALQMKSLTFVIDACKILAQGRKVLAYSCVYSYYNQDTEKMDVMEQQTEALDLHTNALQILLEETLLQCTDLASCVRLLKPEHLNTGLELIRRIQERLVAILQHSTQDFRVGYQSKTGPDHETAQALNIANNTEQNKV